jgi:hypothetical protein
MKEILNRLYDAEFLWKNGRKESAFLLGLIALAAASRYKYPTIKSDREAFEKFFKDFNDHVLNVEFRGECEPIEKIFYKWMRCELVHEGGLPADIKFMKEEKYGTMSIRAGGKPDYILKIGEGWFFHIVQSTKLFIKSIRN